MKFMMIFQGVDRASSVMKKLMRAEKATASAMKGNQRGAQAAQNATTAATNRQVAALARVRSAARSAFSAVQTGASAATRKVSALYQQTAKLGRSGVSHVAAGVGRTTRGIGLAVGVGATVAGGAAIAANQFLDTAKAFESFNIQLETLEGSSAKGKQAMAWVSKFAVDTPLQLDQVVESYRNLKTFGMDPTNGTLQALTDTMAASGKGAEQLDGLILAFGQAWTKGKLQGEEALQMLERGIPVWDILSQKYGKSAAELQKMASKGELGREAITALIDAVGKKNAGASTKMAKTWQGITSNLTDAWQRFELAVMNAGLFDFMKGKAQLALDLVNRMTGDGTFDAWAKLVSNRIVSILQATWTFAVGVYGMLQKLGGYLSIAATYVGGWENLAYVIAGLAIAPTVVATAVGLMQIVAGLGMIAASPAGLVLAGIAAAAWLFVDDWGAAFAWIGDKMQAMARAFSRLKTLIRDIFADPGQALSKLFAFNWDDVIPPLSWAAFIPAIFWPRVATRLVWRTLVTALRWASFVPRLAWAQAVGRLAWRMLVAPLRWATVIGPLAWRSLITPLRWLSVVPKLAWASVVGRLSWSALIAPLRWGVRFIPVIGWAALAGELLWQMLIKPLGWDKYVSIDGLKAAWGKVTSLLSGFTWPTLPELRLPEMPEVGEALIAGFKSIRAGLDSSWADVTAWFTAFRWPTLPTLELPDLPDVGQWITNFGNEAFAAIEAVSARLGDAWGKIKSAFTFGDATPEMKLADPATIKATQAAVASLKADMQSVATIDTAPAMTKLAALNAAASQATAINTGPAMSSLGALEAAAVRVKTTVISSLIQAQAFVTNLSFYNQGAALMDTMAAGIRARASAVTAEIQKMAQQVRNMLPSSPAKTGPLSDIHRLKFGETIAASIRAAPMIKAMRVAATATMAAAAPAGAAYASPRFPAVQQTEMQAKARTEVARLQASVTAPIVINLDYKPTLSVSGEAESAKADFARQLKDHSRDIEKIVSEQVRLARRREH